MSGLADADQDAAHVGQGGQIARGPDRTLGRDTGQDVGIDHGDQGFERGAADARGPARQAGDLQHHQQAHDAVFQQGADAAGMAEHQIALQGLEVPGRDRGVGQQAEAGVDAVDGAALGDDGGDRGGPLVDISPGGRGEVDGAGTVEHGAQPGEGEGRGAEGEFHSLILSLPP